MIWKRNSGNITFISKRKEYDCNYFYLLISRIIRLNFQRDNAAYQKSLQTSFPS